ncbi:uncharacterized protein KY384_008004 [Bacidia gigantensis]|uniref:uncharacterized protein n=1 Tax=Bacidia gigantensis TaxID=2732470 RepID=UPI001D04C016|nr:uncharacterized protein KY384_008004 [Bacidia gigantensis]KAG8527260.1 hypothetical protein KY384_008004 [Bacidia gigantensis]
MDIAQKRKALLPKILESGLAALITLKETCSSMQAEIASLEADPTTIGPENHGGSDRPNETASEQEDPKSPQGLQEPEQHTNQHVYGDSERLAADDEDTSDTIRSGTPHPEEDILGDTLADDLASDVSQEVQPSSENQIDPAQQPAQHYIRHQDTILQPQIADPHHPHQHQQPVDSQSLPDAPQEPAQQESAPQGLAPQELRQDPNHEESNLPLHLNVRQMNERRQARAQSNSPPPPELQPIIQQHIQAQQLIPRQRLATHAMPVPIIHNNLLIPRQDYRLRQIRGLMQNHQIDLTELFRMLGSTHTEFRIS